ncbi:hypothetical protein [Motiliproteus sediminis]|uniref:hypothetical protein n=1 Tax=Motiliproteus sediminis TaxID=1468178 RepID=UPI001AEF7A14|nr:hypothetical protein [Motiliproteus sediminis]
MDYKAALAHSRQGSANVVGLQICGRTVELYRPRFCRTAGKLQIEYREGALFQQQQEQALFEREHMPADAQRIRYFVAPMSDAELDQVIEGQPEMMLHRLLEGAPDPSRCASPRDKAAFTSWCISTLAERNG